MKPSGVSLYEINLGGLFCDFEENIFLASDHLKRSVWLYSRISVPLYHV